MKFKKTEKEIIKTIVKYADGKCSLAEALDKGKLLEKIALKELLIQMRLIVMIPYVSAYSHTIGVNRFLS